MSSEVKHLFRRIQVLVIPKPSGKAASNRPPRNRKLGADEDGRHACFGYNHARGNQKGRLAYLSISPEQCSKGRKPKVCEERLFGHNHRPQPRWLACPDVYLAEQIPTIPSSRSTRCF